MKRLVLLATVFVVALGACHEKTIGYLITENASYDPDTMYVRKTPDPVTDAVRGRLYGRLDVPLHPAAGERMRRAARDFLRLRQALYGAERLPVRVVSSPLARCRESASHVLAVLRAAGVQPIL